MNILVRENQPQRIFSDLHMRFGSILFFINCLKQEDEKSCVPNYFGHNFIGICGMRLLGRIIFGMKK